MSDRHRPGERTASGVERNAHAQWSVVVPVKRLDRAKSRLEVGSRRAALALAFAHDTVTALGRCREVGSIFIITEDPAVRARLQRPDVCFLPDRGRDLNDSVTANLRTVRAVSRTPNIAVVMADLPALRPEHFTAASERARGLARSYIPDQESRGTTALFLTDNATATTYFGQESALAHARAGFVELTAGGFGGLRRDIDLVTHLEAARSLGLGAHTEAALSAEPLPGAVIRSVA